MQERRDALWEQLQAFAKDPARQELTLSSSLSSEERRKAHRLAAVLELDHVSTGKGSERSLTIRKRKSEPRKQDVAIVIDVDTNSAGEEEEFSKHTKKRAKSSHSNGEEEESKSVSKTTTTTTTLRRRSAESVDGGTTAWRPKKKKMTEAEKQEQMKQLFGKKATTRRSAAFDFLEARTYVKPAKKVPPNVNFTKEQIALMDLVLRDKKNVFFTGSAGTGKSTIIRQLVYLLPAASTFVTASTGVAAVNIGGITLHQFAGIGLGEGTKEELLQRVLSNSFCCEWWRCARVLIIDEISMIDAQLFDALNFIAKNVRENDQPFGGIQLVCCGDFFQLPPIRRRHERTKIESGKTEEGEEYERRQEREEEQQEAKFCFEAQSWKKCIQMEVELTEIFRQKKDPLFLNMLNNEIRFGRCSEECQRLLMKACHRPLLSSSSTTFSSPSTSNTNQLSIEPTRLFSLNKNVNELNDKMLATLPGKGKCFVCQDHGKEPFVHTLDKTPAPRELKLKIGAQVMLVKNLDVRRGLVNGTRGVVIGWDDTRKGYPRVRFLDGEEMTMEPVKWVLEASGEPLAVRFPPSLLLIRWHLFG
ncbi:DNA helicase, variant 2 [Balamuthia mandrillaris]